MLIQFLKYQIKSRVFLIPAAFVFFAFYSIFTEVDLSRMVLFMLQVSFNDIIRRNHLNLQLVSVTGFQLRKLLWLHNISFLIWFNVWYLAAQIIVAFVSDLGFARFFQELLSFEMMLMVCILCGNAISTSDYVTFSSKFWQYLIAGFVFGMVYMLATLVIKVAWFFTESYFTYIFILGLLYIGWYFQLRTEKEFRFIKYYI